MRFGTSVAIDGSLESVRAIVGAPGVNAAFLYRYSKDGITPTTRWLEESRLSEGVATNHNYAGSNAVTIFGDAAIVGASGLECAFVYHRDVDGLWKSVSTLRASDRVQYRILESTVKQKYGFGHALDMDRRTVIVGAPFSDAGTFTAQQYHSKDFDHQVRPRPDAESQASLVQSALARHQGKSRLLWKELTVEMAMDQLLKPWDFDL